MRRVLTAAAAAALLAGSANSAHAFFHLLFQSQPQQQQYNQQYYQQYYQGAPGSRVQISPIPREVVALSGYTPGSIVISTSERRLYYVLPGGQAIRYGIGVGRPGFAWSGTHSITQKRAWPDRAHPQKCCTGDRTFRATWREASRTRLVRAPCTSALPFTASTARTSRRRSDKPCRQDASA